MTSKITEVDSALKKVEEVLKELEDNRTIPYDYSIYDNESQTMKFLTHVHQIQYFCRSPDQNVWWQKLEEREDMGSFCDEIIALSKKFIENHSKKEKIEPFTFMTDIETLHEKTKSLWDKINKLPNIPNLQVVSNIEIWKDAKYLRDSREIAEEYVNNLKTAYASVENIPSSMETLENKAEEKLNQINNIYNEGVSSILGGEFDKQSKQARWGERIWLGMTTFAFIGASAYILLFFILAEPVLRWETWLIRITATFWLVAGTTFCASQYRFQKLIKEDYAYKRTLAFSLEKFMESFKGSCDGKVVDEYVLAAMKPLHRTPLIGVSKKTGHENNDLLELIREIVRSMKH